MPRRNIAVRKSGIHGRGVFALRRIRKGSTVIGYRGRLITHEEADVESVDTGHTFLFILNDHYVIDASRDGNSARWINHSCQPNCAAFMVESPSGDPNKDRIVIDAIRDIAAGEELAYDYGIVTDERITRSLKKLWQCRCGSRKCRGTILRRRRLFSRFIAAIRTTLLKRRSIRSTSPM